MINDQNISGTFLKQKLYLGRIISGTKATKPGDKKVFNANIFTEVGKIWYGDLDLIKDVENLRFIAKELGADLYILREMDGRFSNENLPFEKVKLCAVAVFSKEK